MDLLNVHYAKTPPGTKKINEEIAVNNFVELAISASHANAAGNLPDHHSDPFDRTLIAQAQTENLTVMTCDQTFRKISR